MTNIKNNTQYISITSSVLLIKVLKLTSYKALFQACLDFTFIGNCGRAQIFALTTFTLPFLSICTHKMKWQPLLWSITQDLEVKTLCYYWNVLFAFCMCSLSVSSNSDMNEREIYYGHFFTYNVASSCCGGIWCNTTTVASCVKLGTIQCLVILGNIVSIFLNKFLQPQT